MARPSAPRPLLPWPGARRWHLARRCGRCTPQHRAQCAHVPGERGMGEREGERGRHCFAAPSPPRTAHRSSAGGRTTCCGTCSGSSAWPGLRAAWRAPCVGAVRDALQRGLQALLLALAEGLVDALPQQRRSASRAPGGGGGVRGLQRPPRRDRPRPAAAAACCPAFGGWTREHTGEQRRAESAAPVLPTLVLAPSLGHRRHARWRVRPLEPPAQTPASSFDIK